MSDTTFYDLTVKEIIRETPEASTLVFQVPDELKDTFKYRPGQYLTLQTTIGGQQVRRAYSICTAVNQEKLGVTVKKLRNGVMSTYVNDELKVGNLMKVMPPQGHFTITPDHDLKRNHVFIAAGSGITPIMSMIQSVLEEEPMSRCYLLYGNRNRNTIIFKKSLDYLQELYKDQLYVEHIVSRPILRRQPGFSGFFKKPITEWKGKIGRINPELLEEFIKGHSINRQEAAYYICGPGQMIVDIDEHLKSSIENHKHIHVEYFSTPMGDKVADTNLVAATVTAKLNGEVYTLSVPTNKSILDVMIDEKLDPPYSCTSGACSSCMAKVSKGSVEMDACYALDEEEVADGYVLTCQAHPTTAEVSIDFDA